MNNQTELNNEPTGFSHQWWVAGTVGSTIYLYCSETSQLGVAKDPSSSESERASRTRIDYSSGLSSQSWLWPDAERVELLQASEQLQFSALARSAWALIRRPDDRLHGSQAKQDRAFRIVEDKMRDLILALDAFELISWFNNKDFAFYCETLHYLAYLDRLESAPSDES